MSDIQRKKCLSFGHCPKVASTPPPPPLILDMPEVPFVLAHLDNRKLTFIWAKNLNIYPIFRQKLLQNFWNMVSPPHLPNLMSKRVLNCGNTNLPQNFWIQVGPPLFWTLSKTFFHWLSFLNVQCHICEEKVKCVCHFQSS